ncbi:MAG: hypothetical protein R2736_06205 [Solirubrobacterales bacterium]
MNLTYLRELRSARWLTRSERAVVVRAIAAKRETTMALEMALGPTRPEPGDFVAVFPKGHSTLAGRDCSAGRGCSG